MIECSMPSQQVFELTKIIVR